MSVVSGSATVGGVKVTATAQITLPAPAQPASFPPAAGSIFYGASENQANAKLVQQVGQPLGNYRRYFQPSQWQDMVRIAGELIAVGSLPIVSTKAPGTWQAVANGQHDAWVNQIVAGFNALPGPVLWTIHHEPENDLGAGQSPGTFKAMCQHVNALSTGNAFFGPILMSGPFSPISTPDASKRLMLADWIATDSGRFYGFDGYNHFSPGTSKKWLTADQVFGFQLGGEGRKAPNGTPVAGFRDINPAVPVVIAEYGVREDPAAPSKATDWLTDCYQWCTQRNIAALSYFSSDQNVNDGGTPWVLTGPRLAEFVRLSKLPTSVHLG